MTWQRLPAINGGQPSPCLSCGPRKSQLSADTRIGVGFGFATLTKDDVAIWNETADLAFEDLMTVAKADEMAATDPDHDWRIVFDGPLRGSTYQRHGEMQWILVAKNRGFA